jgi:hypothetical protein
MAASKNVKKTDGTQTIFGANHKVVGNIAAPKKAAGGVSVTDLIMAPPSRDAEYAARNAAIEESIQITADYTGKAVELYRATLHDDPQIDFKSTVWLYAHREIAMAAPYANFGDREETAAFLARHVSEELRVFQNNRDYSFFDNGEMYAVAGAGDWDYDEVVNYTNEGILNDEVPALQRLRREEATSHVVTLLGGQVTSREAHDLVESVEIDFNDNLTWDTTDWFESHSMRQGVSEKFYSEDALEVLRVCTERGADERVLIADTAGEVDALLSLLPHLRHKDYGYFLVEDDDESLLFPRQLRVSERCMGELEAQRDSAREVGARMVWDSVIKQVTAPGGPAVTGPPALKCTSCSKRIDALDMFPGGVCLSCWSVSPEGTREHTADEIVRMWGGKA